jgi:hypothetical protein
MQECVYLNLVMLKDNAAADILKRSYPDQINQRRIFMPTRQMPVGSGFGAASTTADVIAGIDLTGKNVIVTGGYSGLGRETVRTLRSAILQETSRR